MPPLLLQLLPFTALLSLGFTVYVWLSKESKESREKKEAATALRDERLKSLETDIQHHGQRIDGMVLDEGKYRDVVDRRLAEHEKKLDKLTEMAATMGKIETALGYMNSAISEIKTDLKSLNSK